MSDTFHGSCHCGRVHFSAELTSDQSTIKCNCSICTKQRAWFTTVREHEFRLLSGEHELSLYQFAAHAIEHRFCAHCGVKLFGKGKNRDGSPFYAVFVMTLDDLPADRLRAMTIHYVNGRHDDFEHAPSDTSLL